MFFPQRSELIHHHTIRGILTLAAAIALLLATLAAARSHGVPAAFQPAADHDHTLAAAVQCPTPAGSPHVMRRDPASEGNGLTEA